MKTAAGVVVVFFVAILNVYVAVPAGYAFDMGNELILIVALAGSVGGTVAMVFVGDTIWPWLKGAFRKARGKPVEPEEGAAETGEDEKSGKAAHIVDRFGAPGLGLIAPWTIGGFAGAISGVAFGLPRLKLALWLALGQAIFVVFYAFLINKAVA
ncbi:MAG: hypothetical protein ACR2N5_01835 [Solirubrobacterales bacterium]